MIMTKADKDTAKCNQANHSKEEKKIENFKNARTAVLMLFHLISSTTVRRSLTLTMALFSTDYRK